jgi:transcriptional regulator GlxA family with amidase domain
MKIAVLVYEGFDEVDAVGPFEVLGNVKYSDDTTAVSIASIAGGETIKASHGMEIVAPARLDDTYDLIVVPGGMWIDRREDVGVYAEYLRNVIPQTLADQHQRGTTICSVCTGAMLLEKAGLLEGREATTHWAAKDDLRAAGATVLDERVVDDGDIVTCGGVTSGFDMALWLVERFWNRDLADGIARVMEIENRARPHLGVNHPSIS